MQPLIIDWNWRGVRWQQYANITLKVHLKKTLDLYKDSFVLSIDPSMIVFNAEESENIYTDSHFSWKALLINS